ncbi:DUF6634 family protein [Hoeflea sp. 108]|uniref:DUF6634 family protein n=1 Tax=Hoeflea sp. 108 TaxID=1116369 RepID=UPI0012FB1E3F|nr:DUF6634 family protein [Hoeflea sp. 108]
MLLFGKESDERHRALMKYEAERLSALATDLGEIAKRETLASSDALFPNEAPVLEFWSIGYRRVPCLAGLSSGHPVLYGDQREIITSDLVAFSEVLGWARTRSRWYRLGQRELTRSSN